MDGATSTFYFPDFPSMGPLFGVSMGVHDVNGYCIKKLDVIYELEQDSAEVSTTLVNMGNMTFAREHFGRGVILSSNCDESYWSVSGTYLTPCFDDGLLSLNTYSPRGIFDLSIHSCSFENSGMDPESGVVTATLTGRKAGDSTFVSSKPVSLDSSLFWSVNEYRRFDINIEEPLTEVTLATLSYAGDDEFCVDVVDADGQVSKHLTNNWLGSGADKASTLTAVCTCDCVIV